MPVLEFIKKSEPKGASWTEIWEEMKKDKKTFTMKNNKAIVSHAKTVGSKETLSSILKFFEKDERIFLDRRTKKYRITKEGIEYIQKSEIVDFILSSNQLDPYFKRDANTLPVATCYNLAQVGKNCSDHPLPLLFERLF